MLERKKRLKQEKQLKFPQRKPHRNYFQELAATPEGRAQFGQWSKLGNAGRKPGTPDGHSAESIKKLREKNRNEARKVVEAMDVDDERAANVIEKLYSIAMEDETDKRASIQAGKIVLEFLKTKPVQKNEVTIGQAEAFLDLIANDIEAESIV